MLLNAAVNQFKVVEPNICENSISQVGTPFSRFMNFNTEGASSIVPRSDWQQLSNQVDEFSRLNVFFLDLYILEDNVKMPCKIREPSSGLFCYSVYKSKKGNRFAFALRHGAILSLNTFSNIFTLIRRSALALSSGISNDTVVTLGLYDQVCNVKLFSFNEV